MEYEDYITPAPEAAVSLAELQKLAELQAEAEAKVKRIEAELSAAQKVLSDLAERQVPELMDSIGIEEFTTRTGLKISIKEVIRASIPKANEVRAFAWLRANGSGALIKRNIVASFGMGEDDQADHLLDIMQEEHIEGVSDKQSVHPSTLSSFVTKRLEAGEELPIELFGVHRQRFAQVKL